MRTKCSVINNNSSAYKAPPQHPPAATVGAIREPRVSGNLAEYLYLYPLYIFAALVPERLKRYEHDKFNFRLH